MFTEQAVKKSIADFLKYCENQRILLPPDARDEKNASQHEALHNIAQVSSMVRDGLLREVNGLPSSNPASGTSIVINELERLNKIRHDHPAYDLKLICRNGLIQLAKELDIAVEPHLTEPRQAMWSR